MRLNSILILFSITLQGFFCLQSFDFTFKDTNALYDLSTYNFAKGRQEVYEYKLTARDDQHKVRLYLFQNNVKQYSIRVFDGLDQTATELQIQANVPDNRNSFEVPEPIVSTGKNMFVQITPDVTDLNAKVDFQALATDHAQPGNCGKMVMSVNIGDDTVVNQELLASTVNPQEQCIYVIHANDQNNNPTLAQYFNSDENDLSKFDIYKGLILDGNHKLAQNSISRWASDKYSVILPTTTFKFDFGWTISGNINTDLAVAPKTRGQFMTNDYYQNPYPNLRPLLEQTFILRLPATVTNIKVTYMNLLGSAGSTSVTVTAYRNNQEIHRQLYSPPLGSLAMIYGCDMLQLYYVTADRNQDGGSGFYAYYEDATGSGQTPFTPTPIQTTTNDAMGLGLTQSTPRPIQKTTNDGGNNLGFVVVTSILLLLIIF